MIARGDAMDSVPLKTYESDLLIQFEAEHDELPPYNRQRALDLMSRFGAGENAG